MSNRNEGSASWDDKISTTALEGGLVMVVTVDNGRDRESDLSILVCDKLPVLQRREMMKFAGRAIVNMAYQMSPSAVDIIEFIDGVREEYATLFGKAEEAIKQFTNKK